MQIKNYMENIANTVVKLLCCLRGFFAWHCTTANSK